MAYVKTECQLKHIYHSYFCSEIVRTICEFRYSSYSESEVVNKDFFILGQKTIIVDFFTFLDIYVCPAGSVN